MDTDGRDDTDAAALAVGLMLIVIDGLAEAGAARAGTATPWKFVPVGALATKAQLSTSESNARRVVGVVT